MDLARLKALGLVTSNPLVKRDIKIKCRPLVPQEQWADPEVEEREPEQEVSVTVYLSKLTAADQIEVYARKQAKQDFTYLILSRCVHTEEGLRLFPTEEDARGLNLEMFAELVMEVRKLNGDAAKKSPPRTKRGASSRSPSADDPSPSGSPPSPSKSGESGCSTEPSTAP